MEMRRVSVEFNGAMVVESWYGMVWCIERVSERKGIFFLFFVVGARKIMEEAAKDGGRMRCDRWFVVVVLYYAHSM